MRSAATFGNLRLRLHRALDGRLQGEHSGRRLGPGSDAEEVTPYRPGEDDVRRIDWNVTARSLEPHVWRTRADHEVETWVLVDETASMAFGTADLEKADLARGATAAVGMLTDGPGNTLGVAHLRVGGVRWDPGLSPVACGRRALRDPVSTPTAVGGASIADGLTRLQSRHGRPGLRVVISDFLEPDGSITRPFSWEKALRRLARQRDTIVIEVLDPRELELPDVGPVVLVDPETGHRCEVWTSMPSIRARYADAAATHRREVAARSAPPVPGTSSCAPTVTGSPTSPSLSSCRQRRPHRQSSAPESSDDPDDHRGGCCCSCRSSRSRRSTSPSCAAARRTPSASPPFRCWRDWCRAALVGGGTCRRPSCCSPSPLSASPPPAPRSRWRFPARPRRSWSPSTPRCPCDRPTCHPTACRPPARRRPGSSKGSPRFNVSVVTFSGTTAVLTQPTTDHRQPPPPSGNLTLESRTAIGEGVFTSLRVVEAQSVLIPEGEEVPAHVVLLSDGRNTFGRLPSEAARAAERAGVPVSTISYGTPPDRGSSYAMSADTESLAALAEETGGTAYTASDRAELSGVYDDIRSPSATAPNPSR